MRGVAAKVAIDDVVMPTSAEAKLFCAVINQAVADATAPIICRNGFARRNAETLQTQARAWLTRNGPDFRLVCELAMLDPAAVREGALRLEARGWPSPGMPGRRLEIATGFYIGATDLADGQPWPITFNDDLAAAMRDGIEPAELIALAGAVTEDLIMMVPERFRMLAVDLVLEGLREKIALRTAGKDWRR